MELARIAALLCPFLQESDPNTKAPHAKQPFPGAFLSEHQLQSILTYINILLRWNERTNLTAIRDPEEIVTRHFGESLFAACHLFPHEPQPPASNGSPGAPYKPDFGLGGEVPDCHLLDLGSGAGFPGLPMKIWAPNIHLTLVESNQKKATFLKEVCRALTLTDVNVLATRAEAPKQDQPRGQGVRQRQSGSQKRNEAIDPTSSSAPQIPSADVVTLRAVERFDQAFPVAASLVTPGGRLALLISRQQLSIIRTDNEAETKNKSRVPSQSFTWLDPIPVPQSSNRILQMGKRIATESK